MMEQIRRLLREAHQRSLWQVLAVYVVAAWVVYEAAVTLMEGFGLPDWVAPTAMVLLLLGLPLVLATAVVQEGGPTLPRSEGDRPNLAGLESAADRLSSPNGSDRRPAPATTEPPGSPDDEAFAATGRVFTWPRTVSVIVLAFATLGLAATGFMGMRVFGIGPVGTLIARGQLDRDARILVADFGARPADSLLAGAVAEALRIDLPQSPVLQVLDPAEIGPALRRMERASDASLDETVARELAVREGIPAVLTGELSPVGPGYQISARLITPDSGRVLFRTRETAADEASVLDAIDRISARLRERAGESLRSIRSNPPLARVTTSSIEALQLYSAAVRASQAATPEETQRAVRLLEEALEQDSMFAMGWRTLGIVLGGTSGSRGRRMRALTRAFELEDRMTEEERLLTRAAYYHHVEGDLERAILAYERILAEHPGHRIAHNNLGALYAGVGDYGRAAESVARSLRVDTTALGLGNLVAYRIAAGDTAGARRALHHRRRLYPGNPTNSLWAARLAYATGRIGVVRDSLVAMVGGAGPMLEAAVLEQLGFLAAVEGRVDTMTRYLDASARIYERQDAVIAATLNQIQRAWIEYVLLGAEQEAVQRVRRAIAKARERGIAQLETVWVMPIALLVYTGHIAEARELLEAMTATVPEDLRRTWFGGGDWWLEGALAIAEGRVEEGRRLQQEAMARGGMAGLVHVAAPVAAYGYDLEGQADSALVQYYRYEDAHHWNRLWIDAVFLAFAYERMAQLHEERGEISEAVHYYRKLLDLWEHADSQLQPRVDGARRALVRLTSE